MAAGLLTLALLAGCGSPAPPPPPGTTDLRVALSPLASVVPAHVAASSGIFDRHGLRVTLTEGNDLNGFAAALDQGQYDIVLSVPSIVLVAADHGLDVQVVNRMNKATADHPGTVWITRDPAVESIGQLRGARIGVPALTGQLTDSVVYLLQRAGVAKEQVTFVQTPFATMLDQLNAGRLDAAVAGAPFSTVMATQGYRLHDDVVVSAVREATGGARDDGMTSLFASSSAFTSSHPQAVRAWQESLHEAVDRLRTDDAEWRAELRSWMKMPPEVAGTAALPVWELDVTPADLQPYVTIARSVGSIERDPDVDALVWQDHP